MTIESTGGHISHDASVAEVSEVNSFEADYWALRKGAGVLGMEDCTLLQVEGSGAEEAVEFALTREIGYMTPDRTMMALALDASGAAVDIVTVYRTDSGFLLQTSRSRSLDVAKIIGAHGTAQVQDVADRFALLAVEGPNAIAAASSVLDEPVDGLPFQAARHTSSSGDEVIVSRTGVTGEFGFTFVVATEIRDTFWRRLTEVGEPVGSRAVEAAMVEVRQPVLAIEWLADDDVVSAGLNWLVDIEKPNFSGRDAVLAAREGTTLRRLSVLAAGPVRRNAVVKLDGVEVGRVVCAVPSPSSGRYAAIIRVEAGVAAVGLELDLDGVSGQSVSSPMVTPTSWSALQA